MIYFMEAATSTVFLSGARRGVAAFRKPQEAGGFVICFSNTLKLMVPGCSVDQYEVDDTIGLW